MTRSIPRSILGFISSPVVAIVACFIFAALSEGGVQNVRIAVVLLWMADGILAAYALAFGMLKCPVLNGTRSAQLCLGLMTALLVVQSPIWWLRGHIVSGGVRATGGTITAQLPAQPTAALPRQPTPIKAQTTRQGLAKSQMSSREALANQADDLANGIEHLYEHWRERTSPQIIGTLGEPRLSQYREQMDEDAMDIYNKDYKEKVEKVHSALLLDLRPVDEDLDLRGYYERGFNADSLELNAEDLRRLAKLLRGLGATPASGNAKTSDDIRDRNRQH